MIIDEDLNLTYSFSIHYLSNTANMTISGSGLDKTYTIDSFSSTPSYLTETNVYNDAVIFINQAVEFLEILGETIVIE